MSWTRKGKLMASGLETPPTDIKETAKAFACANPMTMSDTRDIDTAETPSAVTKRQRRHAMNNRAMGMISWSLNSPSPTKNPAEESRRRVTWAIPVIRMASRSMESCPCISAMFIGKNATIRAGISNPQFAIRVGAQALTCLQHHAKRKQLIAKNKR